MKDIRKSVFLDAYEHLSRAEREEYDKLWEKPLAELFKMLDDCHGPEGAYDWKKSQPIESMIATKLHIVLIRDANKDIHEILSRLLEKIKEVEKTAKEHRHNLDKSYSEKPVW